MRVNGNADIILKFITVVNGLQIIENAVFKNLALMLSSPVAFVLSRVF